KGSEGASGFLHAQAVACKQVTAQIEESSRRATLDPECGAPARRDHFGLRNDILSATVRKVSLSAFQALGWVSITSAYIMPLAATIWNSARAGSGLSPAGTSSTAW